MDKIKVLLEELVSLLKQYFKETKDVRPDNPPMISVEEDNEPTIVKVPGVKYKLRGKYKTPSGMPLGPLVHYTVSGRTAASARAVVKYLADQGLGALVMDENGIFYCAENYNFLKDVVYHAGVSTWQGKSGVSFYTVGIEICNWGTDGDRRGAKDLRTVPARHNMKAGTYQMFTQKQEASLINFINYLKKMSPDFNTQWIVGHDEVSPNRKQDPGGSLSMTMPELRTLFVEKSKINLT